MTTKAESTTSPCLNAKTQSMMSQPICWGKRVITLKVAFIACLLSMSSKCMEKPQVQPLQTHSHFCCLQTSSQRREPTGGYEKRKTTNQEHFSFLFYSTLRLVDQNLCCAVPCILIAVWMFAVLQLQKKKQTTKTPDWMRYSVGGCILCALLDNNVFEQLEWLLKLNGPESFMMWKTRLRKMWVNHNP